MSFYKSYRKYYKYQKYQRYKYKDSKYSLNAMMNFIDGKLQSRERGLNRHKKVKIFFFYPDSSFDYSYMND